MTTMRKCLITEGNGTRNERFSSYLATSRLQVFELFLPCNLDARVYRTYKNIMSRKYDEKRKKAEG